MVIDYFNNKFIISTNFNELDLVRKFPCRKFVFKTKMWEASPLKLNVMYIKELMRAYDDLKMTQDCLNYINNFDDALPQYKDFPTCFKFKYKPRSYQVGALNYVYNLNNSMLAMAMGTGKSKIIIDLMNAHFCLKKIEALVIICPCSIRYVWEKQLQEHAFFDYDFEILDKRSFKKIDAMIQSNDKTKLKILVCGVESLQLSDGQLTKKFNEFTNLNKVACVVDEAHDIKNPTSNRFKNIFNATRDCVYRIAMTGTPVSQGVLDLFGIYKFLDSNILGIKDFWSFKNRYTITETIKLKSKEFKKIVGYKNVDELMNLVSPYTFQVTKDEASKELPSKVYMTRFLEMENEQSKIYTKIKKDKIIEMKDLDYVNQIYNNALSLYVSLQQVSGGFVNADTGNVDDKGEPIKKISDIVTDQKNKKLQEIKSIIDELPDNEQVIIWCKYRYEVEKVTRFLNDYKVDKFKFGAVSFLDKTKEERQAIQKQMDNKEIRYFVSTPNSGGTGLTINTVCYVIYYSNSERLLFREQSEDRCHRIGQNRTVTYFDLIYKNTVDEKIYDCLKSKKDFSEHIKQSLNNINDMV